MGHHNIHFHGDPHAATGIWGIPTSRANFCEEDYGFTRYLAEFINSISNIAYLYLALRWMYSPARPNPSLFRPSTDFMSVALLVLGIGSFLFHASMRQAFEFVDELSMLVLNWSMLHAVLSIRQTAPRRRAYSLLLAAVYISFSLYYIYSAKIIYQVVAFLSGMAVITARTQYLFHGLVLAFPKDEVRRWSTRTWQAIGISSLGYLVWNVDLEFCWQLRQWKSSVGLPWSWLLELHGWWHLLTAVGADRFMMTVREMREWERLEKEQSRKDKTI